MSILELFSARTKEAIFLLEFRAIFAAPRTGEPDFSAYVSAPRERRWIKLDDNGGKTEAEARTGQRKA